MTTPPTGRGSFRSGRHQLVYETWGDGERPFVLLHGMLMDARLNRGVARQLAARGHRVVLLDLLGHGESDKPRHAAEYRMDVYREEVVGLLDHLELERAVLGGVSLGANVSLQVAVHHPDGSKASSSRPRCSSGRCPRRRSPSHRRCSSCGSGPDACSARSPPSSTPSTGSPATPCR